MKTKFFYIITALIAVIAATALSGCKEEDDTQPQRKILISSIPDTYNGQSINLVLTQLSLQITTDKAYGEAVISNQMAIVSLTNIANNGPFTGSGIGFGVEFTITGNPAADESYTLKNLATKAIYEEITTITWTDFDKATPPQTLPQKKIVITNIPSEQSEQNDKTASLVLLQSNTQKASASGTISTTSVTFNLTTTNSQNFTGIGLFTVKLTVNNTPPSQSLTYEAIKLITAEATTMAWTDFRITGVN